MAGLSVLSAEILNLEFTWPKTQKGIRMSGLGRVWYDDYEIVRLWWGFKSRHI